VELPTLFEDPFSNKYHGSIHNLIESDDEEQQQQEEGRENEIDRILRDGPGSNFLFNSNAEGWG
jgi:hypothetical protein